MGRISADITRDFDDSRENAAGDLIADAQLADTDDADRGRAVAALMNPGGVTAAGRPRPCAIAARCVTIGVRDLG